jgi:AraC-like DNA-binding protein
MDNQILRTTKQRTLVSKYLQNHLECLTLIQNKWDMFKPALDGFSLFTLLGIVQAFFLILIFFSRSQNRLSNRLLGLMILSVTLTSLEIFLCYSDYIVYIPWFVDLTEPCNFLYPPLMYFYTLSLVRVDFVWKRKYLFHFIPSLLHFVYRLPSYLQSDACKLQSVIDAYHKGFGLDCHREDFWWSWTYRYFYQFSDSFFAGYAFLYFGLSLYLVFHFAKSQKTSMFFGKFLNVNWISRIIFLFLLVEGLYFFLSQYYSDDLGEIYITFFSTIVFFGMSYQVISYSEILHYQTEVPKKKYEKSNLEPTVAKSYLEKLTEIMKNEKPYLKNDLTLPELSEKLKLSTHYLSQLLNKQLGKNFFDFVNEWRIEEMKEKLRNPKMQHLKIEELAFESGFNSKSVFNNAFKKFTQSTPSEYRKRYKQEDV